MIDFEWRDIAYLAKYQINNAGTVRINTKWSQNHRIVMKGYNIDDNTLSNQKHDP